MKTKLSDGWYIESYTNNDSDLRNEEGEVIHCWFDHIPEIKIAEDFRRIYQKGLLRGKIKAIEECNILIKQAVDKLNKNQNEH